jgi:hypothetical protein
MTPPDFALVLRGAVLGIVDQEIGAGDKLDVFAILLADLTGTIG